MNETGAISTAIHSNNSYPKMSEGLRRRRHIKDNIARWSIGFGGISVIFAVCLIFFYLVYEVLPLFRSAEIIPQSHYPVHHSSQQSSQQSEAALRDPFVLSMGIEEQNEIAYTIQKNGQINFFDVRNGELIEHVWLHGLGEAAQGVELLAISGVNELFSVIRGSQVLFFTLAFEHTFDDSNTRKITPKVEYPYGESWQDLFTSGFEADAVSSFPKSAFTVRETEEQVMLAVQIDQTFYLKQFIKESDILGEETVLEADESHVLPMPRHAIQDVFIGPDLRWMYIVEAQGTIEVYDLWSLERDARHSVKIFSDQSISSAKLLLGGNSLLVGLSDGSVRQFSLVRDEDNHYDLVQLRQFNVSDHPVTQIQPEERTKGFAATDDHGLLAVFNTTAERRLVDISLVESTAASLPDINFALSPRANYLLSYNAVDQKLSTYEIHNEHPEISWGSIWNEVWYEGYPEPEYIWQSSASNNDFEPKYSLVPLAFGTLKAAFYAMLLAVPLAICGAIYTAYFMAPALRAKVKPAVELMEALPTVILGFLAGLWLAPLLEDKLPGVFALLFVVPLTVLLFSFAWLYIPSRFRHGIDNGWQPLLLVPLIVLAGGLAMMASDQLEAWFFGGNIRGWLTNEMGIGYDQRNALVVGLAMGFAVIPTIFSIAEDALFAVPKHLSFGSLALGASPWQTVVRVVLPTASPGIFSAVMIGFGRAVGETMIVLMATGNTPIMEMNIFEGLRTLSANIAVEMPEAERDSTHYRILFLAALVLFMFTFMFNTTAEYVRQRLREKYGTL